MAFHSSAAAEADAVGLTEQMREFTDEPTLVRDLLWFADMTTGPDGKYLTFEHRMADVRKRYPPDHYVIRALDAGMDERRAAVARAEKEGRRDPHSATDIRGSSLPTQRRMREIDRLRADQEILRAAATWVREQPGRGMIAVLSDAAVAGHCADLLDHFADYCDRIDDTTRRYIVRVGRALVGDHMDQPSLRRTRRRQ